jgi:ABC-2 type transport system ATP-binding protein
VHLALTMAIDAKLLVLDEPTLGLDILARRSFYDALVNDYMDETRTIVITTHQVEEVENLLTDAIFIAKGRIVLDSSLEAIAQRFCAVSVAADRLESARALKPFYERYILGKTVLYFEDRERTQLADFGELHTPSIADLFVAKLSGDAS